MRIINLLLFIICVFIYGVLLFGWRLSWMMASKAENGYRQFRDEYDWLVGDVKDIYADIMER